LGGLKGRGARHTFEVAGGSALLIDESYNANPASMAATIAELGRTRADRHVAILATMKEMGEKSAEYHLGLKPHLDAAKASYALLVGEEMAPLAEALAGDVAWVGKFTHCASVKDAIPAAKALIKAGDAILVKGSNSMGLSAVVDALVGAAGNGEN
jgi:UDP-N-acetylmuramoyl-tripeptide--D-alanyl-D-alanine ligase